MAVLQANEETLSLGSASDYLRLRPARIYSRGPCACARPSVARVRACARGCIVRGAWPLVHARSCVCVCVCACKRLQNRGQWGSASELWASTGFTLGLIGLRSSKGLELVEQSARCLSLGVGVSRIRLDITAICIYIYIYIYK